MACLWRAVEAFTAQPTGGYVYHVVTQAYDIVITYVLCLLSKGLQYLLCKLPCFMELWIHSRLSQMQRMRWSCRKMYQDEIACFLSLFPAQI